MTQVRNKKKKEKKISWYDEHCFLILLHPIVNLCDNCWRITADEWCQRWQIHCDFDKWLKYFLKHKIYHLVKQRMQLFIYLSHLSILFIQVRIIRIGFKVNTNRRAFTTSTTQTENNSWCIGEDDSQTLKNNTNL